MKPFQNRAVSTILLFFLTFSTLSYAAPNKKLDKSTGKCLLSTINNTFQKLNFIPAILGCFSAGPQTRNPLISEETLSCIESSPYVAMPNSTVGVKELYINKKKLLYQHVTAFRELAEKDHLIHENVDPRALVDRPGIYNYVITKNGTIVFGQVKNFFENGVKHLQLADGRPVVAAGELEIDANGIKRFNILSGTFSREIMTSKETDETIMSAIVTRVFSEFDQKPAFIKTVLTPTNAPSDAEKKSMCSNKSFCSYNRSICGAYFLIQLCDNAFKN